MKELDARIEYADIIDLPHPESRNHKRMKRENRAAQFAPFAALTGFDGCIDEAKRLTDQRIILDENEKQILDSKLSKILAYYEKNIDDPVTVSFTFFVEDLKKDGGKYINVEGIIKKMDSVSGTIILRDGTTIKVTDIAEIDCEIFNDISPSYML